MKRRPQKRSKKTGARENRLYTLEVLILDGPMTGEFTKQNPVISRTIQIRADQTLTKLHDAIFYAFDRDDEHMYEFQFGKRPLDPESKRYELPMALDDSYDRSGEPGVDLTRTTIGSLGLQVGQEFYYWFDFGDDWWHQIKVVAIEDEAPRGRYPRVTKRVGESPPQYIDWDEEGKEG